LRYTEVELQLALLERDLDWLDRTGADRNASRRLAEEWLPTLAALAGIADEREAAAVADARRRLLTL
jgi:hypothetical protein